MLHRAGLLTDVELAAMLKALDELDRACADGSFRPTVADEDVHTALERGLLERLGALGGKLRAGRSRNDQVATDLRLYLRDHARFIASRLAELESALIDQAVASGDLPAPGMTHLQHAQPVLFAQQLLAHVQAFARDVSRLRDWDRRAAISPLGSGALAGSSLPVDPQLLAAELGFDAAAPNSMDAVSDRDFAAEFCFDAALIGVHLSRLGEEIVLWSSQEFSWVEIDDAYATGSSIMPQKKNPDVAELARGKAGRLIGGLTGLLTTLKGLPLTYNRDLQEDKEPVFDAVDTLLLVLPAMAGLIATLRVNPERLRRGASVGFTLATDLAEYLVRRGVPFREAHEVVGHLVVWCQVHDCDLADVSDADLAKVSEHLTPDVREVLTVEGALAARKGYGGTAPERVAEQIVALRATVDEHAGWAAGYTGAPGPWTLIPRDFFARLSVPVAPDLLGCVLEHQTEAGLVAVELTEVEAYAGASDPASHSYRGKTARNAVMFGPPGHAYVYFTYGMHFCVNVVCLGNGSASAVLFRAGRIVAGEELARTRRTREGKMIAFRDLARGRPGYARRSTSTGRWTARTSASPTRRCGCAGRRYEHHATVRPPRIGHTGPRVGVSQAAERPWRFWIEGDPTVSAYRPATPRRRKLVTP